MESFDFIESGIVFGIQDIKGIRKFRYIDKDFATHGDAYNFVLKYFDDYGEPPSVSALTENFPTLDPTAQTLQFDYALDSFKNQVLYRKVVRVFQTNKETLQLNPKKAYIDIVSQLDDIGVSNDEDVISYASDALARLQDWKIKREQRLSSDNMLGVPTSFTTVNDTGVGWLPGELISVFARPSIGKTWFCVHAAAVAASRGFKTLLISPEMPISAINLRADVVFANMMGYEFSHRALRSGDAIDEDEYKNFLMKLAGRPLLVCDHISGQASINVNAITSLIRKHSPDFIVLDGAYLVNSGAGRKASWEESHALFYGLKNLCTAYNVSMMVSTQANRDASDIYKPPQAETVAFGDALLRASDVVLSMCLIENEPTRRLLQFQKYRDAEAFADTVLLHWNPDIGDIYELNATY